MTRDRDNVPRWLNRLVVLVTAVLATIVVLAGASIVYGAELAADEQTSDCTGDPAYCTPPTTTEPPVETTAPATTAPATTAPATTEAPATTAPVTTGPATTAPPPASTEPPATTEPTVSVAPPPVPSSVPEPCPADAQGRQLRSDCTPDPCVIRTGPTTGYTSPNYVPGHVPGGDQGTTQSFVVDCTVPTTPVPSVSPALPVTGGNGTTLSIVALGLLAAGTALVAASRRRPA